MLEGTLQSLPPEIRWTIYRFAFGSELTVESHYTGHSVYSSCPLLHVSRRSRGDVLHAYGSDSMTVRWVFKSPAALRRTSPASHWQELHQRIPAPVRQIRTAHLVFWIPLEHKAHVSLKELEEWYEAWRRSIGLLIREHSVSSIFLDLSKSSAWGRMSASRLVAYLCAFIHERSKGTTRCYVAGWWPEGRRVIEEETPGVATFIE